MMIKEDDAASKGGSCDKREKKLEVRINSATKKLFLEETGKRKRKLRSYENKRKVVRKMIKGPLQLNLSLVSQEEPQENTQNLNFLNPIEVGSGGMKDINKMRNTRYSNKQLHGENGPHTDRASGYSDITFKPTGNFRSVNQNNIHSLKKNKENVSNSFFSNFLKVKDYRNGGSPLNIIFKSSMVKDDFEEREEEIINQEAKEEELKSSVELREIPELNNTALQSPINQENLMKDESIVSNNNPFSELFIKYKFRKTKIPKISKYNHIPYLNFKVGKKRLTVSTNGRRMFVAGGDFILLLKRGNLSTGFQYCEARNGFKIFGFRATPSGHVVLQEQTTHNLIILNKKMEKQAAFVAPTVENEDILDSSEYASPNFQTLQNNKLPTTVGFTSSLVNPHFSFEDDKIIWCSDPNNFHIVGLRTLEKVFIKGLHPPENLEENYRFLCSAANFKNLKFLVVYEFESERSLIVFKDVEMEESLYYNLSQIMENKIWEEALITCVDVSKDKERYFMGSYLKKKDNGANIGQIASIIVGIFNRYSFNI